MTTLTGNKALRRWRANPTAFIEQVLVNPETRRPFELLPAEIEFLKRAFMLGPDGRLLYPELLYSCPKKSGKTVFAAIFLLTTLLLFGGPFAEGYTAANDLEQSVGRVFEAVRRIIECSPLLRREARVANNKITFTATGATISALASDYAGAAGAHPCIVVFDELWAYVSERSRRLFDELVQVPTRQISCRLTVTRRFQRRVAVA